MADYDAMKEILGNTIQGVIVKKNLMGGSPAMSLHLVFSDRTYYERDDLRQGSIQRRWLN